MPDALVPPFDKQRLGLYLLQLTCDVALLFAAYMIVAWFYVGDVFDYQMALAAQVLAATYIVLALYNRCYSAESLSDWKKASLRMIVALALAAALINLFAFYTKTTAEYSRVAVTLGFLLTALLLVVARWIFAAQVRQHFGPALVSTLVLQDGGPAFHVPHAYHVSTAEHALNPTLSDPHGLDRLGGYLRNMDRVIVSCPVERRQEWSLILKGSGVHGEVICNLARDLGAIGVRQYDGVGRASLVVSTGPLGLRERAMKRALDLVLSGAGLLVLAPVFAVVAVLVKLQDGGPVLFRQQRLGRGNCFFNIYKFRTMRVDRSDAEGRRSASRDDDRVTPIGRVLRRTSLDELPQLWNVLLGQMSMVGPRPHAIGSQAGDKTFWEVDRRYWQRHSLKPGLTGLAQIRGLRGATPEESDLRDRLQADLEYVSNWSIWGDIWIVLLTVKVVVHDRAY